MPSNKLLRVWLKISGIEVSILLLGELSTFLFTEKRAVILFLVDCLLMCTPTDDLRDSYFPNDITFKVGDAYGSTIGSEGFFCNRIA